MTCLRKRFNDKMLHQKTFAKKAFDFLWFLVRYFNISEIFYKIKNLNYWLTFPVISHLTRKSGLTLLVPTSRNFVGPNGGPNSPSLTKTPICHQYATYQMFLESLQQVECNWG